MDDRPRGVPGTRLPREVIVLYLLGPFLITPVVEDGFFDGSPVDILVALARNALFFVTIPPGIHALYRFAMPPVLRRVEGRLARLLVHAVGTALVALAGGLFVRWLLVILSQHPTATSTILFRCVVFTWAIVLPAMVVQSLRERARASERRLIEQRQAALAAQLEALQARTNPHFLFNVMNTIASLVQDDPDLAERTIERLADVLRYTLESAQREAVALGDELDMIRDYLDIQRVRFGDRLRYAIDVEPGLEAVRVPPLLVQPLVENAVLHGVGSRPEGGTIRLVARRSGGGIDLAVDDDGPGPGGSAHRGTGVGLRDLTRRLELLHGGGGGLVTGTSDLGGFRVEIAIPAATGSAP
jgi:two-component system sensor histidine kinase AlgZ